LNEGGYYALPKLSFPGGVLVGCSAGFLDVMKIKGTHNAIKSGMVAAETIYDHLHDCRGKDLTDYETRLKQSWIYKELYQTRNFKGAFKRNLYAGLIHAGVISFITKGLEPWSLHSRGKDS
jgi:electron-transferring-flavoprotein dehydrogenase